MSTALPAAPDATRFFRRRGIRLLPGLVLTAAIALVATWLGSLAPLVGAPVFGIVLGVIIAIFLPQGTLVDVGARFAGKRVLQGSVILLGTGLSLAQVATVGVGSLPVMLGTLAVALLGAWGIGLLLRVDGGIRTLVGVGTGICGASAIAATTAVIGAAEADVAYAIGTIFTFNIAAVLLFPAIGHLLGLSQHAFGLWAGTAVNDTSSVVAAGYTYGQAAGSYAVIVKLTRTLMIIPITLVLALVTARRSAKAELGTARDSMAEQGARLSRSTVAGPNTIARSELADATAADTDMVETNTVDTNLVETSMVEPSTAAPSPSETSATETSTTAPSPSEANPATMTSPRHKRIPWGKIIPLFIVGFLVASALDTFGVIPGTWHPALSAISVFMITMALAGIGLGTRLATIRSAGVRPLLLGGMLWVLVAVSSLLLQWLTGTL
ncbi:YeiH family protein [Humibacter sp.]|uniref:YeiH family protein n=1 Tax=Humibacter sp. TaxID=1940291 RepID=UPI002CA47D54|nr:putative sulfate exporter family transporter [Humibacter sp.]HVX06503.1 putative sulfate exporter family transporter [Humibacter sp.]